MVKTAEITLDESGRPTIIDMKDAKIKIRLYSEGITIEFLKRRPNLNEVLSTIALALQLPLAKKIRTARLKRSYTLAAGQNNNDLDLKTLPKNEALFESDKTRLTLVACDMVFASGTGTGLVSTTLLDRDKTAGVSPINNVPLLAIERGTSWFGRLPVQHDDVIRFSIQNAVAADVIDCVVMFEIE